MTAQNKANAKNNTTRMSSFGAWQRARMSMPRSAPKDIDKDLEKETPEEVAREARTGMESGPRAFVQQIIRKISDED